MTTFALLHGAYGSGAQWAPLVAELEARGHRVAAPGPIVELDCGHHPMAELPAALAEVLCG